MLGGLSLEFFNDVVFVNLRQLFNYLRRVLNINLMNIKQEIGRCPINNAKSKHKRKD